MGLLSKAAAGTPKLDEPSQGGLLNFISKKQLNNAEAITSPMEKEIMEKLFAGYAKYGVFQGLIIETLNYSAGEFTRRISSMVSDFGSTEGLSQGRALVIFSIKSDGELIGKHLAKTVPGNNLFSFQADNPREAFLLVKPFL